MLLMGESINGTRKQVAEAIQARDAEFIKTLAKDQIDAGAGLIDVNGGVAGGDEVADLLWLIETVMGVTDMQLMVDSANPKALDAGVQAIIDTGGKVPFINSISGEQARIDAVLPLVEKHKCPVVGLCLSDEGIPPTAEDRFAVAKQLYDLCTGAACRPRTSGSTRWCWPCRPTRAAPGSPWRRSSSSRIACRPHHRRPQQRQLRPARTAACSTAPSWPCAPAWASTARSSTCATSR